ncbi:uncharacterized protein LOC110724927 [Chenopodium quinoa]|uniref:uncharacterized protein LOC110696458 n=1 Tax=Chenopodium quinoa TaxID=63459 RepID=UPI000B76C938|nr:uncharacterized protein LOC110696458 [Chenopodium quinoa]XP_021729451.1 uncharacterized protein LOC110696467 [Chenopodium quinoa]XP_021733100.1 uncharacterized protein LOC110699910 [Chenopodium quinoa]XP_021739808.1 uncharacterized protein LOC110706221 [Chenopodium quinoa]XP_021760111.1 uncharacterized protein LOC110724927 [Chenopodium quinoa]
MKRRLKELKLLWPSSKKGKQHLDDAKKRKHNSKAPFGSDSTQQNLVIPTNSTAQAKIVGGRIIGANQLTLPNHVSSNSDVVGNLAPDTIVENVRGNLMDTQGNMDCQHGEEHYLDGANDQGHLEGALHSTECNRAATLEETFDPMVIESHMDTHQQAQGHLEGALHSTESNRAATLEETFDPMVIGSHMDIQQQVQGHLEGALHTTESSGTIVVKATYKEHSVRIVFSLTLPINQLIEETGMKFQLALNKYRLFYQDEDKAWMMLTSVEDLKYASNVAESLGTKFVRLSVIDYVV